MQHQQGRNNSGVCVAIARVQGCDMWTHHPSLQQLGSAAEHIWYTCLAWCCAVGYTVQLVPDGRAVVPYWRHDRIGAVLAAMAYPCQAQCPLSTLLDPCLCITPVQGSGRVMYVWRAAGVHDAQCSVVSGLCVHPAPDARSVMSVWL
jgi:hypothetical protein